MNLYGRFFLFLLNYPFIAKHFDAYAPIQKRFRVWLQDIDVNAHLTAARYFSFGDLGRIQWLASNGLLQKFFFTGYKAVLNAQEMTYIREFRPLSHVDLTIELKSWDEKYGYFEQRFYHQGQLYAVGHARMAILHQRQVISFGEVFKHFGHAIENKPETEAITDWKETLRAKREYFAK